MGGIRRAAISDLVIKYFPAQFDGIPSIYYFDGISTRRGCSRLAEKCLIRNHGDQGLFEKAHKIRITDYKIGMQRKNKIDNGGI